MQEKREAGPLEERTPRSKYAASTKSCLDEGKVGSTSSASMTQRAQWANRGILSTIVGTEVRFPREAQGGAWSSVPCFCQADGRREGRDGLETETGNG